MKVTVSQAKGRDVLGIKALQIEAGLPLDGIDDMIEDFRVVRLGRASQVKVIACGGVEVYGGMGVLRSVVVTEAYRGKGIGERLVNVLLGIAKKHNLFQVVLFTRDAVGYFADFGFEPEEDAECSLAFPDELCHSSLWDHPACDDAIMMIKDMS